MTDLISSNDEQQEMAKQVEAIAEAAAQRDSQIAQMLNLVPKAAALSTAASRAISFTKKTWVDDPTSGTPITAADMNRLEQAIVDLNTTLTSVQNSLSQLEMLREVGDLNSVNRTCFFYSSQNAANSPEGLTSRFAGFAVVVSPTWCSQFAMTLGYNVAYVRGKHDGSWSQWAKV